HEQRLALRRFQLPKRVPHGCLALYQVLARHFAPALSLDSYMSWNRLAVPSPLRRATTSRSTIRSATRPSPAASYGFMVRRARSRNSEESARQTAPAIDTASLPTSMTLVALALPS